MIAAFVLLFVAVLFRVLAGFAGIHDMHHWLHNFSPIAAIALCGAVYLPRKMAVLLPLAALFVSDIVLNVFCYRVSLFTWEIIPHYLALGLISTLGFTFRGRVNLPGLLGASIAGSLLFYIVTNTGSWIGNAAYTKTFAGWVQAQTTGLPGYPPTWQFFRHTLVSDLLFTLLFCACMTLGQRHPAPALQQQPAR